MDKPLAYFLEPREHHLSVCRTVMSPEELAAVRSAEEAIVQAAHRSRDIVQAARRAARLEQKRGFADGRRMAEQSYGQQQLELELRFRQERHALYQGLAEMVVGCAEKLLGELGPYQALQQRALEIMRQNASAGTLLIKLNPAVMEEILPELEAFRGSLASDVSFEADPQVALTDVVVKAGDGLIKGSVSVQLADLLKAFKAIEPQGERAANRYVQEPEHE